MGGATAGRYTCDYPGSRTDPVLGPAYRGLRQSGFTRHYFSAAPLDAYYSTSAMQWEAPVMTVAELAGSADRVA